MQGKKPKGLLVSRNSKRKQLTDDRLPLIPDKLYFSISEVSDLCAVKAYVLRYWEQEFPQLKPVKRRGNRRYYQHRDILLVRKIRKLLYEDGFTLEGARAQLSNTAASNTSKSVNHSINTNALMKKMIADLESVLQNLQSEMT